MPEPPRQLEAQVGIGTTNIESGMCDLPPRDLNIDGRSLEHPLSTGVSPQKPMEDHNHTLILHSCPPGQPHVLVAAQHRALAGTTKIESGMRDLPPEDLKY